eukprot:s3398_g6.t2
MNAASEELKKQRPSAAGEEPKTRRLSFINCSVNQIESAIQTEWADWRFNGDFWSTILTGDPAIEFRVLSNRTLEYWVRTYNRWQDMGRRSKSAPPNKADLVELEQILNMPRHRLKDICKLFDYQGWKKLDAEGMSPAVLQRVKIPVVSLMTAGVMLSQIIAPKHKMRFNFGMADLDDSRTLDEAEFVNFITAFIRGLGAAFGISQKDGVMPSLEAIREIGRRLYNRISAKAAEALVKISRTASKETRAALIQAIKERQQHFAKAASLERQLSVDEVLEEEQPPTSMPRTPSKHVECVAVRQVLNFATIEAWCFREYKDPLALPYALAFERFCARGSGADLKKGQIPKEWHLSHKEAVELPKELDSRDDAKLPARWQVLFLRDVFNYCKSEGSFQLTFSDLEYGLRRSLTPDLWDLVSDAMRKMSDEIRGPATFFHFLKKAYPGCQPKHLATFQDWCNQYDELQRRSAEMDLLTEAAALFEKKNAMPILPVDDQARLEKEFEEMDMFGTGCVEVAAIQRRWDWDEQMTRDIIAKYDLSEDGCLDKGDFLRMMCPDGFRLPSMQGADRDVFGMLLTGSIRYLEDAISTEEGLYAEDVKAAKEVRLKPMPFSLLPEIPEATWLFWNDLFTRLDADEDDHIRERDLLREGLLSPEVAKHLMSIIDPEHPDSFTRRGFLTACLKATGCRRAKFECGR